MRPVSREPDQPLRTSRYERDQKAVGWCSGTQLIEFPGLNATDECLPIPGHRLE
jgi:hypothetical protein